MVDTDTQARVQAIVTRLKPEWRSHNIEILEHLSGGFSNDNYRIGVSIADTGTGHTSKDAHKSATSANVSPISHHYALRCPGPGQAFVDRHREIRVYEHLVNATTATHHSPELIALDPDGGAMITRWVPGRLLATLSAEASAVPSTTEVIPSTPGATELAGYVATLHASLKSLVNIPPYPLDTLVTGWLQQSTPPAPVTRAIHQLAGAAILAARPPSKGARHQPLNTLSAVAHNDLNPYNVILRDNTFVTLDFEFVGQNHPLFDVVALHEGLHPGHPGQKKGNNEELRDVVNAYLAQSQPAGWSEQEITATLHEQLLRFWLREYAWAFDQLLRRDHEDIQKQAATALEKIAALTS